VAFPSFISPGDCPLFFPAGHETIKSLSKGKGFSKSPTKESLPRFSLFQERKGGGRSISPPPPGVVKKNVVPPPSPPSPPIRIKIRARRIFLLLCTRERGSPSLNREMYTKKVSRYIYKLKAPPPTFVVVFLPTRPPTFVSVHSRLALLFFSFYPLVVGPLCENSNG